MTSKCLLEGIYPLSSKTNPRVCAINEQSAARVNNRCSVSFSFLWKYFQKILLENEWKWKWVKMSNLQYLINLLTRRFDVLFWDNRFGSLVLKYQIMRVFWKWSFRLLKNRMRNLNTGSKLGVETLKIGLFSETVFRKQLKSKTRHVFKLKCKNILGKWNQTYLIMDSILILIR